MSVQDSPLGKQSLYVSHYDAGLLHPIPRSGNRESLKLDGQQPFFGVDIWNGYELSWLNEKGKPQVATAEFRIPCESPSIIESKSFKLYLNSFNQTRFATWEAVRERLETDLTQAAGAGVGVTLFALDAAPGLGALLDGTCIDGLDVEIDTYHPEPALLKADASQEVSECLVSHLLKSNCPVTGQPDWASLVVRYQGPQIDHASLLKYLVSFREHQDFHEHCVERMFCEIRERCRPQQLLVYARYTRRGGLDINPLRSSHEISADNIRLVRQ